LPHGVQIDDKKDKIQYLKDYIFFSHWPDRELGNLDHQKLRECVKWLMDELEIDEEE
jgi:hypothetical protein